MNSVCKAAEIDKIQTQAEKMIKEITGNDELRLWEPFNGNWNVYDVNGRQAVAKYWNVLLWCEYEDKKELKTVVKNLEKALGIKSTTDPSKIGGSKNINDSAGKYGIKVPFPCTLLAKIEDDQIFKLILLVFVEDIQEIWDKYNQTIKFDFKRFGTPGGLNDAAGRTLQVGDVVAFMRRAGTGGMELGVVSGLGNKRPNIQTEDGNSVSLDGSQICLIQRGNNVVQ
jgi:hypothetical protein